ncbi:MAG: hypothetical protein Q8P18_11425 [Pseudomonadota bacterium]|nr:hypothetical protein [Pseudomonadota bacterium]
MIVTARNAAFHVDGATPVVTVELLVDGCVVDDVQMHGHPNGDWSADEADLAQLYDDSDFRALGIGVEAAVALLALEAGSGRGFAHLPLRNPRGE